MWISRKQYNFLKENAEKNINAECAILTARENQIKAVARAMEAYSAVLTELDKVTADLKCYLDTGLTPEEFKESVDFTLELNKKLHKVIKDLKYYLDTNEENGVVYIPKFVIEKIVSGRIG